MSESAVDRLLIDAYGKHMSVEEAAEYSGVPPDEVARRTTEALGVRNYLGEVARIELLMRKLEDMAGEIQSRLPDMSDRNVSAAVNAAAGAMGRVLGQLTKIQASSRVDVNAITASQGRELGRVVDIALTHLRDELKARYSTDDAEIDDLIQEGILIAVRGIDDAVSD